MLTSLFTGYVNWSLGYVTRFLPCKISVSPLKISRIFLIKVLFPGFSTLWWTSLSVTCLMLTSSVWKNCTFSIYLFTYFCGLVDLILASEFYSVASIIRFNAQIAPDLTDRGFLQPGSSPLDLYPVILTLLFFPLWQGIPRSSFDDASAQKSAFFGSPISMY